MLAHSAISAQPSAVRFRSADIPPEHLIVIVLVSSHRVCATVAALHADHGERVIAHKSIDSIWETLSPRGRREVVADAIRQAEDSAGIQSYSIYLSVSEASIASRTAVGWASVGEEVEFGRQERDWALRRAREQATGSDRELVELLPVRWTVRSRSGEAEVDDPVGRRGNHLTCEALLVTARRGFQAELQQLAKDLHLDLDGVIAQPVALYHGISGRLHKRGGSIVIDHGARHTSLLVRRRDRLVHLETFAFGGDDLTRRISETLLIDWDAAEQVKREADIGLPLDRPEHAEGQLHIFSDLLERNRLQAPATRICQDLVRAFFKERADDLRGHGYLAQQGHIHLVGRGASLGGMAHCLRDIFDLPVVLGTGDRNRQPGEELDGLLVAGLVCAAADHRREQIARQNASLRKTASGLWSWLTKRIE